MAELTVRGRSREMARAREALRRAAGQGQGCVLSVTGDPGIGKTTLLEAIRAHALSMGFAVGFAKVDEVSAITPGAPVLLALRSGSRPLLDDAAFRSLAALYDKTLWLVDRIADLLETRAQQGPILIVLDDMQWADPLSRLAVRILASRLSDSPVVWAVSARDEPGQMLADLDTAEAFNGVTVEHVELGPLADADVIAIATDILGAPPAAAAAGGLRRAGGNPLLAVQYSEGVALDRARGRDSDTIPTSLATALRARTRSLGPDAMRILQLAAVWGRPLELATAAQMLGSVSPGLLLDSAAEAVASGLLERPGNPIAFRHDLVREFVYEGTPESERVALHELCASCLVQNGYGPLEAASHARLGARRGDRKAIGILREAAAACGMAMPQTAADLMQDAFEGLAEADPLRPEVGEEYAGFLAQAQRGADVIAVVDALLSQPHSAEFDARLQALAARALWLMGLPDDMARRTGNALAHSGISKPLRSRLKASRALAFSRVGPPETALAAAEAALAEGDMLGDRATLVLAREALGEIARNEGRHLAAYEHFHELRTLVGASYLAEEIAALQFIDRFDEADALLMEASRSAGEGLAADLPSLVCAQLWQDFKLGRFDEAVADAQTLLRVTNEIGNYVHRLDAHVVTSTIAVVHGNLGLARELLAKAEDEEAADDPVQVPGLVLARARIAAADGDFGAGLRLLKPLMSSSSPASRARPDFGWAALTDSEVRVARLVSAGHTNRSVAELLGVTTSTIGTHLRSIFAKMDVQSRVQLANAVRGGGPGAESPRRYGRGPA